MSANGINNYCILQQYRNNSPNYIQWKIEFPENNTSNAYFALFLTQHGSTVRYYALPSEENKTPMILKSSVSPTTNVYVFSWRNLTEVSKLRPTILSTYQPPPSPPGRNSTFRENHKPKSGEGYIENDYKVCYCTCVDILHF